jgi:hypothetical protein
MMFQYTSKWGYRVRNIPQVGDGETSFSFGDLHLKP